MLNFFTIRSNDVRFGNWSLEQIPNSFKNFWDLTNIWNIKVFQLFNEDDIDFHLCKA